MSTVIEEALGTSEITDAEFGKFRTFIYDAAGISLSESKKAMVAGRLAKRLRQCGLSSYAQYLRLLQQPEATQELQTAIDLLTTNETYFFREPKHFEFLRQQLRALPPGQQPLRVWSAASSSGEEAYSIAMLLEDLLPTRPWEVVGSDISTRVLEKARRGHYALTRTDKIPPDYLKRFCLKGEGQHAGTMLVERSLRNKVRFVQVNLNESLPHLGQFDVVFLRNVLIYFDAATKRQVVERVVGTLRPGGWLLIGHSESLAGITDVVANHGPSIFRKSL
ncbi:MAG: protein-glutamate O-methyltransferase CheR [Steroidobacteraceae bacterium]